MSWMKGKVNIEGNAVVVRQGKGVVANGVAGAAVGTILFPVVGTIIGGLLGAAHGAGEDVTAIPLNRVREIDMKKGIVYYDD